MLARAPRRGGEPHRSLAQRLLVEGHHDRAGATRHPLRGDEGVRLRAVVQPYEEPDGPVARRIDEEVLDGARDAAAAGGQRRADEGRDETGSVHALPAGVPHFRPGPSSGLHASAYPGSRGRSPRPPAARRRRLPARPRRRVAPSPSTSPPDTSATPPCCTASWRSTGPASAPDPGPGHLGDPLPYALAGLVCVVVAFARGRAWRALAVAALFVVTGVTTQVSSICSREPRLQDWLKWRQIDATSWPSGHSTAMMTLALCAVLVAPPALRTAAVGSAAPSRSAWAMRCSCSDGTTPRTSSGATSWPGCARRWPSPRCTASRSPSPPAGLELGAAHRPGRRLRAWSPRVAVGVRTHTVALYALERPTFVAGALTIPLLALALVATVSAASTRGAPRAR